MPIGAVETVTTHLVAVPVMPNSPLRPVLQPYYCRWGPNSVLNRCTEGGSWVANSSFAGALRSIQRPCRWFTSLGMAAALFGGLALGQSSPPAGMQSYALKHRTAVDMAPQLRSLLQGLPEPGEVLIDTQRNQLLVQGSGEAHQVAAQFVQALDQPGEPVHKPESSAPEVQGYRIPEGDSGAVVTRLQAEFGRVAGVRIALDDRTQQIIVVAPAPIQKQIAERIGSPATAGANANKSPSPGSGSIAYQLQHITWRELEDGLTAAWGPKIRISVSENGEIATIETVGADSVTAVLQINRRTDLVRSLDAASAASWLATARALDVAPAGPDSLTRLVPVQKVDPEQVRTAVSLIRAAATRGDGNVTTVTKPLRPAVDRPRWGGELLAMLFQDTTAAPATPAARKSWSCCSSRSSGSSRRTGPRGSHGRGSSCTGGW